MPCVNPHFSDQTNHMLTCLIILANTYAPIMVCHVIMFLQSGCLINPNFPPLLPPPWQPLATIHGPRRQPLHHAIAAPFTDLASSWAALPFSHRTYSAPTMAAASSNHILRSELVMATTPETALTNIHRTNLHQIGEDESPPRATNASPRIQQWNNPEPAPSSTFVHIASTMKTQ